MVQLNWETALVTGASRGIGRGIAIKLAKSGVKKIGINYCTNDAAAKDAADKVKAAGAEPVLYKADVTDLDQVKGMFEKVKGDFGGNLGVFVHNARPNPGVKPWFTTAMEMTPEGLDAAYRSQIHALVLGCQASAPMMAKGGRIIGITHAPGGKTGSWTAWASMGPAKAALEATLRYFAVQLATKGITVNIVSPGLIDDSVINGLPPEAYKAIVDWNVAGWIPMKRMGTPADIGDAVALLAAPEAGFITGQTLYVDGGASVMYPEMPLPIQGL